MRNSFLTISLFLGALQTAGIAQAQEAENLGAGVADIVSTRPSHPTDPRWTPPPNGEISLVNVAPMLLTFVNNGSVYGLPGTVTGPLASRTQLGGDWGGLRTSLIRHGVFFDHYSVSAYQDVTSGGLEEGGSFVQNHQLSLNVDTGRAGLWSGGLLHVTAQARFGESPGETLISGASAPSYVGLVLPDPTADNKVELSEYYVAQALSPKLALMAGKISDIYIPDQTAFANSYKTAFANFNFNKNPMTINFYNPTAWAVLGAWKPTKTFSLAGGVLDPYSKSDNFAKNAFDKVNLYLMAINSYEIGGLPGQFSPAFNWSNAPKLDLRQPFGRLTSAAQVAQAVGVLVESPDTEGLPINYRDESWFAIANLSQYLYLKEAPGEVGTKLRNGQHLRGLGVFGRVGYAPERTNRIHWDASLGLFGEGMMDARPNDSFGVAYYHNGMSDDLKASVARMTAGARKVADERGMEAFYSLALTPAVKLSVSYQHIWDPLTARVAVENEDTDIVLTRLSIAW